MAKHTIINQQSFSTWLTESSFIPPVCVFTFSTFLDIWHHTPSHTKLGDIAHPVSLKKKTAQYEILFNILKGNSHDFAHIFTVTLLFLLLPTNESLCISPTMKSLGQEALEHLVGIYNTVSLPYIYIQVKLLLITEHLNSQ